MLLYFNNRYQAIKLFYKFILIFTSLSKLKASSSVKFPIKLKFYCFPISCYCKTIFYGIKESYIKLPQNFSENNYAQNRFFKIVYILFRLAINTKASFIKRGEGKKYMNPTGPKIIVQFATAVYERRNTFVHSFNMYWDKGQYIKKIGRVRF